MNAKIISIKTKTTQIDESDILMHGMSDEEVLEEADDIIAEKLEELNRHSRFCYTSTEIAKPYGMSGADLLSFLTDQKVVRKLKSTYQIARKYKNEDLVAYRFKMFYNQRGRRRVKAKLVWTAIGREFIKKLIRKY